ncbi:MAG: RNA ligase family protein [Candidatus Coatesbacteria bacterium]|nr:RNA ligase family protein [Candidatus Coatesbacteria bacterium]
MNTDFFKFPHTPYLLWLGMGSPRVDKVLSDEEAEQFLDGEVHVEEKVDGANIGISLGPDGEIRAQNRGNYLTGKCHPQFDPLWPWISLHSQSLRKALEPGLLLFGEWCYAQHSIHYDELPDWFLAFDIYDAERGEFWSVSRRNALVHSMGLCLVPELRRGNFKKAELIGLMGESSLTNGPMEGIYIRKEEKGRLIDRAKIVRAEFTQSIEEHWTKAKFRRNALGQKTVSLAAV